MRPLRPVRLIPLLLLAAFDLTTTGACRPACDGLLLVEDGLCVPLERTAPAGAREKLPSGWSQGETGSEPADALVDLAPRVDLHRLGELFAGRGVPRRERRRLAVAALEAAAEEGRRALGPLLEELAAEGSLRLLGRYAVLNRLRVQATPEALERLAGRPEVLGVLLPAARPPSVRRPSGGERADPERVGVGTGTGGISPAGPAARRTSWALEAIGAPRAWAEGLDGAGVVVGLIDSGASAAHEQLRGGFRGGERSWYDPAGGSAEPIDAVFGHGSGVLSAAVGSNVAGVSLGVAPGARWVACAGLPRGRYDAVLVTECADWMLRVAQPDVLINAWLLPEGGCDPSLRPLLDAWRVAEILPIFAAGNLGPEPGSDRSPANYGRLYPGAGRTLAVGGLGRGGEVVPRSARGPSSCDGGVFPTLAAPAENLITALPLTPSSYRQGEGTSYAAGLAAGAAALLLQRFPEASVSDLEEALAGGAVDLGPPGPDVDTGHGRLDVPGALDRLTRPPARRVERMGRGQKFRERTPRAARGRATSSSDRAVHSQAKRSPWRL